MSLDYAQRARDNFQDCDRTIAGRVKDLIAFHNSKGILKSGATAKKAIEIYELETASALDRTLTEVGNMIDHRGRKWNAACAAVGTALEEHLNQARESLSKPFLAAGATGDTEAAKAVDKLLEEVSDRLRAKLTAFRDGWTAPREKPWKERHPNWDRIFFAIIGAVAAAAVAAVAKLV